MKASLAASLALLAVVAMASGADVSRAVGARNAPISPRLLYSSDWTGHSQIFAVDPSRRAPVGQVTAGEPTCDRVPLACGFAHPVPSPDGKHIAYLTVPDPFSSELWVARANGAGARRLAVGFWVAPDGVASDVVAWSPDSNRIAYFNRDDRLLHVVRFDGSDDRVIEGTAPSWGPGSIVSPDGRWSVRPVYRGARIVALRVIGASTVHVFDASTRAAWSSDSRLLAFSSPRGIRIADARTGRTRRLTRDKGYQLAWAPDGRSLAYIQGDVNDREYVESGDLRTVTLSGRVTTVVDADRAYGGRMVSLAWVRSPTSVRYRKPEPAPANRVSADGVLADWPVERLAADGDRVAYGTCGRVFVWTPGSGAPSQPEEVASLSETCGDRSRSYYITFGFYTFALAGERLAIGEAGGGMGRYWRLSSTTLPSRARFALASGGETGLAPCLACHGETVGSGGLLVFSSWKEEELVPSRTRVTTRQTVHRVEDGPCPCPALRTEPGPIVPFDVDGGRVAAGGDNALLLLGADGAELLSVPVRALTAALSGRDLVVLVQGELRHYDAADGRLLHAWPLPDVPSGHECRKPKGCAPLRLRLEDAARGIATYVFDGRVHVLRLADGADAAIGTGSLGRFMDAGLVYADGTRIHVVPFERLPLR